MITLKIDLTSLKNDTRSQVKKEEVKAVEKSASAALRDLEVATPVDTGAASEAWEVSFAENKAVLSNSTEYIKYLNAGSSKQAPANFIENTVLKHGEPIGSIVTYT